MPKGYTSRSKIENFLLITVDESFHDQVDNFIEDTERFIDTYTERNFVADSESSARYYDGFDTRELRIDDCVEVETVEIGGDDYGHSSASFEETTDYITSPANAIARDTPINTIILTKSYFPGGVQNHRVTAKWGYSEACPGDISMAATILAAHLWKFGRGGITGGISQEKIGNYSVSYDNDKDKQDYDRAIAILDRYVKHYL